jgi:hypothetical protein
VCQDSYGNTVLEVALLSARAIPITYNNISTTMAESKEKRDKKQDLDA